MDMEVTMVLTSTTLSCVFVGLQLYHVRRHPNVLPFMSLTMMSILTFGHIIPLLLNFVSLLGHQNPDNKSHVSGPAGWLEVNEIAVRLVTMVPFWLHIRLLQLTWSSRNADESNKGLWGAEMKVALITLQFYATGLLLLVAVLFTLKEEGDKVLMFYHFISHGGSVVDGFLLPQIILNEFSDMTENVLSRSFYLGTTFVRLLHHSCGGPYLTLNYAFPYNGSYAGAKADFSSIQQIIWNIVIPMLGIIFAITVSMQQHFGPHYILPQRLEGSKVYERVTLVTESEAEVEKTDMKNAIFDTKCKLPDHGEPKLGKS